MSDSAATGLMLSTQNLTADGARVQVGESVAPFEATESEVLAILQAYAQISPMDLLDAEVRIYLKGKVGKASVQCVGGQLVAGLVPEAAHIAARCSPEQVLELVMIGAVVAPAPTRAEADRAELADLVMPRSFWSRALNSNGLLGTLVLIAGAVAYSLFAPTTPAGLVVITDAKEIARLHVEINGRYGTPGATELVLANGELAGWTERTNTSDSRKIFALGYRYARRDDTVVLMASNGAELRIESGRRLLFMSSAYPRKGA